MCDPDWNAYTEDVNPRVDGYPSNIRCAGNHVHFGIPNIKDFDNIVKLIKYCDLAIGLPSVFVDTDTERRKLYGKAGCFRKQPWCAEYRTLSSKMLQSDNLNKIWDGIEKVVDFFNEDIPLPESDLIQRCINTSNQVLAKHLIDLYKEEHIYL